MKKIKLDISSTPYTIDTYQMFTFDSEVDQILEELGTDYDSVDWEYDTQGYVQHLADNWLDLMNKNILDNVILKIELDGKAFSPKFYNFSTDNCGVVFTVDQVKLNEYIKKNQEHYNENKRRSYDGYMCFMDEEEKKLDYYLAYVSSEEYTPSDYQMDQYETSEAWDYIDYKVIAKIIATEKTENGNSYKIDFGNDMKLWFDTWEDDGELTGDWNKYIFGVENEEDQKIKAFQEEVENFETALNLCINQ